jgi:N-acyl-L-homoserine lactone synthetase
MTTLAVGSNRELSSTLMVQMHEFRHEIFVKRLGWSLPMLNGVEQDQYDNTAARYVIQCDDAGRVTACARLVPTTGSYMLPELFPQLLGDVETPRDATTWELSRFATNVRETREGRILSLSAPTVEFLDEIIEFARGHGIERLVLVTSVMIERLMLRAGVAAHRLAPPAKIDGTPCVALFIDVTPEETADPRTSDVAFTGAPGSNARH